MEPRWGGGAQLCPLYISLIYEKAEEAVGILTLVSTPRCVRRRCLLTKSVIAPNFSGCITSSTLAFGLFCQARSVGCCLRAHSLLFLTHRLVIISLLVSSREALIQSWRRLLFQHFGGAVHYSVLLPRRPPAHQTSYLSQCPDPATDLPVPLAKAPWKHFSFSGQDLVPPGPPCT